MSESMTKEQYVFFLQAHVGSIPEHEANTRLVIQSAAAVAEHDPVLAAKLMDCINASQELVAYLKTKVEQ